MFFAILFIVILAVVQERRAHKLRQSMEELKAEIDKLEKVDCGIAEPKFLEEPPIEAELPLLHMKLQRITACYRCQLYQNTIRKARIKREEE